MNPYLPVDRQNIDDIKIKLISESETKEKCPRCRGVLYRNEYMDDHDGEVWYTLECEELECNFEIDVREDRMYV